VCAERVRAITVCVTAHGLGRHAALTAAAGPEETVALRLRFGTDSCGGPIGNLKPGIRDE
jgi:hypothetical protein